MEKEKNSWKKILNLRRSFSYFLSDGQVEVEKKSRIKKNISGKFRFVRSVKRKDYRHCCQVMKTKGKNEAWEVREIFKNLGKTLNKVGKTFAKPSSFRTISGKFQQILQCSHPPTNLLIKALSFSKSNWRKKKVVRSRATGAKHKT